MPNNIKKSELPRKLCPVCQRPFTWRKKWERNWGSVVYCSDRCRRNKQGKWDAGTRHGN